MWWAMLWTGCATPPQAVVDFDAALEAAWVDDVHALRGGWGLVASDGEPVGVDDLVGGWTLVGVGYTSCPDVCPTTLTSLPSLLSRLEPLVGGPVTGVFVAVDPARDRAGLEAYRAHFDVDGSLRAWTGEPGPLATFADDVGLAFSVDGTDVQHSTSWALIDPAGRVVGYVLHPTEPDRVVPQVLAGLSRPKVGMESGWLRPPPPGTRVGAAYGILRNDRSEAVHLVAATTSDRERVAVHETVTVGGVARMRPTRVEVPASGRAELRPLGAHLMVPATSETTEVVLRLELDDGTALWHRFGAGG